LTPALRTEVDTLRTRGASIAVIAERLGVSTFTVRAALGRPPVGVVAGGTGAGAADPAGGDADADADGDTGTPGEAQIEGGAADLTDDDVVNDRGDEPDAGDTQAEVQEIEVAAVGSVDAVGGEALLPVLPDPVDRSPERVAARWGLLPYAPPVFAPAARVPLAGLFLAVPALAATGLLEGARQVYGGVPGVARRAAGRGRHPGQPDRSGSGAGPGPGPGGQDGAPQDGPFGRPREGRGVVDRAGPPARRRA
jgi:hypothetical protein